MKIHAHKVVYGLKKVRVTIRHFLVAMQQKTKMKTQVIVQVQQKVVEPTLKQATQKARVSKLVVRGVTVNAVIQMLSLIKSVKSWYFAET